MRDRAPGAAVMEQVVRLHEACPQRSRLARALGRHPLSEDAQPWFSGALGEREVGALLSRLPQGWSAFHAVPVGTGDADVDHLVVGPGGVFVINTKHHRGARVTIYARSVLVEGVKKPYLRNSDLEASRVRGLLLRAGIDAPVEPVIVIVGAKELRMRQKPVRAAVLRSEGLVRWLSRRPNRLDAADRRPRHTASSTTRRPGGRSSRRATPKSASTRSSGRCAVPNGCGSGGLSPAASACWPWPCRSCRSCRAERARWPQAGCAVVRMVSVSAPSASPSSSATVTAVTSVSDRRCVPPHGISTAPSGSSARQRRRCPRP